jgi:hypothetical protein
VFFSNMGAGKIAGELVADEELLKLRGNTG